MIRPNHTPRPYGKRFRDRPARHIIETLTCAAFLAAALYGFFKFVEATPEFHVRTIRVEGAEMLKEEAIIAQSGVTTDDCIFFLNPWFVKWRVENIPFVRSCEVRRVFPDKLIIKVRERVALATLMENNRLFELDRECNVLRELSPEEQHVGPLITDVAGLSGVTEGQHLKVPALTNALSVWRVFCKTEMARYVTVSEICAAQENRICMFCDELPCEIRWGRSNFERQAWKLDVLWKTQKGHITSKEYVDLRFGDDIACK